MRLRIDIDGTVRYEPASNGLDAALEAVLEAVVAARHQGLWQDFKACAAPDCGRVFYDTRRGRPTRWCTNRCGDRIRGRAYRRGERYRTLNKGAEDKAEKVRRPKDSD